MSQLREQAVRCVKRAWSFAKRQSLKVAVGVCMFTLSTGTALASSKGAGGFTKATTEIASYQTLYVVKQKCTTANIVIYSEISLFYYQKFFC